MRTARTGKRDGVSSAYRQVKELIAAFRVRMGTHGLGPALEEAMEKRTTFNKWTIGILFAVPQLLLIFTFFYTFSFFFFFST